MFQLLDGGMGTELKKKYSFANEAEYKQLWSAAPLLNKDGQDIVKKIHSEYIECGCNIITTNTYACTQHFLSKHNLQTNQNELIKIACKLAKEAIVESGKNIKLAGSIPPLNISYRADLVGNNSEIFSEYSNICKILNDSSVDIFLCETMSSVREALIAYSAAQKYKKPIYLSFTLSDELVDNKCKLRSGECIRDIVDNMTPDAILFNCCKPEIATIALKEIKELTDIPIGIYANSFVSIPDKWELDKEDGLLERRTDLSIQKYTEFALQWKKLGCNIIGGCCGISVEHMRNVCEGVNGVEKVVDNILVN